MDEPPRRRCGTGRAGLLTTLASSLVVAGCSGGAGRYSGALETRSLGEDPVVLLTRYDGVFYTDDADFGTSFILTDVSLDDLLTGAVTSGQVMHIEMLWEPRPGLTPMDSTATNVTIRHIVIAEGELGIYEGGGFALPSAAIGASSVRITIKDATVRLLQSTDGFQDLLSPAQLTGTFTAKLNPRRTQRLYNALSQYVTNVFGRSMLVSVDPRANG